MIYITMKMAQKIMGRTEKEEKRIEEYRRTSAGSIYIIQSGNVSLYKIGVTKSDNIKRRFGEIVTPDGGSKKLIYKRTVRQYQDQESVLHNYFSSKRIVGEWFDLNANFIMAVIQKLCECHNQT